MSGTVISVEGVSKAYRLGMLGGSTLAGDLAAWWAKMRGRPNPHVKIGQEQTQRSGERFWALRDVSFQVRRGEVLGIVGRNGAGKSTLLKILSQVTVPTKGYVRIRGRMASLLEVGTGFHPELTGRENIYLNGAILGMRRQEIERKFKEIVDFSGVGEFIDTPVKRYSSGMHLRLAFSVAAHLDPEILVVDEVLAVGDAAFQNKCLGKVSEVAKSGRTVLFVSHNMAAVRQLCGRAIWLHEGVVIDGGETERIIRAYLRQALPETVGLEVTFDPDPGKPFQMLKVRLCSDEGEPRDSFHCDEPIVVELHSISRRPIADLYGYFAITHTDGIGTTVLVSDSRDVQPNAFGNLPPGIYTYRIAIPPRVLGPGEYQVHMSFASSYYERFLVDSPGYPLVGFRLSDLVTARGNNRGGYISTLLRWAPAVSAQAEPEAALRANNSATQSSDTELAFS